MAGIRKKNQVDTSDVRLLQTKERPRYDIKAALAKATLVFALVYGSIGGFLSAYEIAYQKEQCILAIFWLAFLLSAVYETRRKWAVNLVNILVFLLYVYVAFQKFWVINSGYYAVVNRVLEDAGRYLGVASRTEYALVVENEHAAVTGFALFIGMVGTILLQIRLRQKVSLWTTLLLTFPFYAIPFYFEKLPGVGYMMLLFIGYATVAAIQGTNVREQSAKQAHDILPVITLFVVVFVQVVTLVLPRAGYTSIVRANAAKKALEREVANVMQYGLFSLFGRGQNGAGVSGGMLSKGSAVIPDFETDLIVRYTPYSYDPVYLKAFTGKDYTGDRWTRADGADAWMEQTVAGRAARYAHDEPADRLIGYALPDAADGERDVPDDGTDNASGQSCGVMEVVNVGASGTYDYRPYYTDHARRGGMDAEYVYFPPVIALQDVTEEVDGDYLIVPESCRRAVERICREAGFSGTPREIAAQVTAYFDEQYSYTLRPGFYYGSSDYITHFLLESKRGYCAHFASSAVMLFRNMGIPARYAEGYAFTYEDMILDGTLVEGADYADYYSGYSPIGETALVELEIADASAHAWVEIYIEGEGWVVVDPTPASNDEEERSSFWDDFLGRGEGGGGSDFGESNVGAYIETAVSGLAFVLSAAALVLLCYFTGKNLIRRVKERRLPARERAKLEYRRLAAYLSQKNQEFAVLRTIKEQTDWINAHCRRGFTEEQNAALYEMFFAGETTSKADARWEALIKHCSRRWSFRVR
ncbi:MAG: transglutaminase-like domain-containing protein [Lachnospiraceae bacterium]|nr:transglutaminase-like domain-containing protein [Lachnospiraceae bacterium]MDE7239329.1 transglutaminase-like domain-containing protein [Lachnospiraceae bacterium]